MNSYFKSFSGLAGALALANLVSVPVARAGSTSAATFFGPDQYSAPSSTSGGSTLSKDKIAWPQIQLSPFAADIDAPVSARSSDSNPAQPLYMDTATTMQSATTAPTNGPAPAAPAVAAAPQGPNIHGFAGSKELTDYITPRGLVVVDEGLVSQPIVGLVFPIGDVGPLKGLTFVGGIWNCIASHQSDPHVGPWNEMDDFFSLSTTPLPGLNFTLTYVAFNSPNGAFVTEHNMDLMTTYDDSSLWGGNFGIHPYLDFWYAMAGNSTVILGRSGGTCYFQPGIVPTYTLKVIPEYPVTFTVPTYLSVGPKDYWSFGSAPKGGSWGSGSVGVFATGIDASVPLSFVPGQFGSWSIDVGVTYFDIINNALLAAGTIASGNTRRDIFMGAAGLSVKF